MQNDQTKSKTLLAKILSQENISVQIVKASTASFELKTRTLSIPEMKNDLPDCLYNLFVGHEIAHALETPTNFMSYMKQHKLSHSLLNIVEDVRIERLIQQDYPGLRRDFILGYRELLSRNFFGIKGRNVQSLGFLDRLNIHAKCGVSLGVNFTPREQTLVDMAFEAETWKDVIATCIAIKEFLAEQPQVDDLPETSSPDISDDEDEEQSDINWGEDGEDESNSPSTETDEDKKDENKQSPEPKTEKKSTKLGGDELDAETYQAFESMRETLLDKEQHEIHQINIVSGDYKQYIIPHRELASILSTEIYMEDQSWVVGEHPDPYIATHNIFSPTVKQALYAEYKASNDAIIKYMVKEFNLKKNADIIKRTAIGKTGVLNHKKLFSFQFNNDLFLKKATVHEGQSHGMVIYVDWSGSMKKNLFHSMQQLFCLLDFCKFVNIPFEVYAVNSLKEPFDENDGGLNGYNDGDVYISSQFQLLQLFSSKMTLNEYTMMQKNLLLLAKYGYPAIDTFVMWGTPLNEAIICAMDMVPDFQKQHNLQIVNAIFITDGESNPLEYIHQNETRHFYGEQVVYVSDEHKNTVKTKGREDITAKLLEMMIMRTKANLVGFFLTEPDIGKFEVMVPTLTKAAILAEFTNNGSLVSTCSGYHEYYLINVNHLEVKTQAKAKDAIDLIKQNRQTMKNRIIMNRFIDIVAKQPH